jgi:hypothetical protein
MSNSLLNTENIATQMYFIRGEKVLLDFDLAMLYEVETKRLKEAVRRNKKRFPADFMFELTDKEFSVLRSQFASSRWGGRRYPPMAFTEQGVAMLSGILNSDRAVEVNIAIMRTFVQLRKLMDTNKELSKKIEMLEKGYDEKFDMVFAAIKQLIHQENGPREKIGYKLNKND